MGKVIPIQTNFTAGELSPRVHSRIDIAKYNNGLKLCENIQVMVQGGARRRPGLRLAAETKNSAKKARLIPFIYNADQAYVLEVGDLYLRVFKDGALVGGPYEVTTPYTEAILPELEYVQGADTMYIMQGDTPVYRLQRYGDTDWRLLAAPFTVEPFDEVGIKPALALTLSAATVGTGRNFSAASAFLAADVGRYIVAGSGQALITAFVDASNVTCEIQSAFSGTSIASSTWTLDGSPQTTCTVSAVGPVGASVTATLGANGWRAGSAEVGKYIKVNGGLVKITGYTSPTVVNGTVQQVLASTTAAIANSWTLNASIWGGSNKYPRTGTLYEQRLLLAGSAGFPQTVVGSRIGDTLNFELGTNDSDAFSREVASAQVTTIRHLGQGKRLMVFTSQNEMSMRGGQEKPITPTNIQKNDESTAGSNQVRPVKIGNEILFIQRAGRKVRACGYRQDIDGFESPDRTVFSEHITGTGIVDMAFQQEPDALLYCVRADGQIAVSTYDTEQEVNAWGRWITDGQVESVAVIPTPTAEQVWVIVKRTINGATKRFVEYFDLSLKTDCAKTMTSGSPQTVWTGLSHLEGKTVKVLADGVPQADKVVTGGQITLDRTATAVEVGLGFTPKLKMLNPEVGSAAGTTQAAAISVGEVIVRVLDTVGVEIDGQAKDFRSLGSNLLDRPPEVGTGELRETTLAGELYSSELEISQSKPVDFHVLAVIRKCTIND
jgi:hypothetical protein